MPINANTYKMCKNMIFMVSYRTSMQIVGDLLTATEQSGQEGIKMNRIEEKWNCKMFIFLEIKKRDYGVIITTSSKAFNGSVPSITSWPSDTPPASVSGFNGSVP